MNARTAWLPCSGLAVLCHCLLVALLAASSAFAEGNADLRAPIAAAVMAAAAADQAVEAMVLLDDADETAAELSNPAWSRPLEHASEVEYRVRMDFRDAAFRNLKARVKAHVAGHDVDFLTEYSVLPVMHVRVRSAAALLRLAEHDKVLSVDQIHVSSPFLAQSLPLVQQPAAASGGFGGAGTTVAVLDTGVDYTRSAFGSCAVPGGACKVVYAQDLAPHDGALDDSGHGSNVAGIALGVAPDARIASLDVFRSDGLAYDSDIMAAINWCVAQKATYNIASINMSLGAGRYYSALAPSDTFGTVVQNAINAGIIVVAASGNNGYTDSIGWPAAYSNVLSVGAVYDANVGSYTSSGAGCTDSITAADKATCYSNSASFLGVLAPGTWITAAGSIYSGTSMATPHVAGAVAVLRAAYPSESVTTLVNRLKQGALVTDARNGITKPRLNLVQALGSSAQTVRFGASTYSVAEGTASVTIPVSRSGGTTGTVTVNYSTANGTGMAGSDYTATAGTLTFAAGVATMNIVVPVFNDSIAESSETFTVTLSDAAGAGLAAPSSATVTITDDDSGPPAIVTPAPGSTLTTTTVTFAGGHTAADLQHYLYVGTSPGGSNFSVQNLGTGHSATVSGLPSTGTIHVRYWTRFASGWVYTDQSYTMSTAASFSYALANSGGITVTQGGSGTTTVTATLQAGATQAVSFAASGLPSGATAGFNAASCSPTCSSTLTISTSAATPTGTYTITVTGTPLAKTTTLSLTINGATTTAPAIVTPPPGSTLTTSTVTFTGGHTAADLQHYLYVGTSPGGSNVFVQNLGTGHSATVSGLPSTGTIHVRYWTRFASGWVYTDQSYTMNVGSASTHRLLNPGFESARVNWTDYSSAGYTVVTNNAASVAHGGAGTRGSAESTIWTNTSSRTS
jgi:subtilisin family serine protease